MRFPRDILMVVVKRGRMGGVRCLADAKRSKNKRLKNNQSNYRCFFLSSIRSLNTQNLK